MREALPAVSALCLIGFGAARAQAPDAKPVAQPPAKTAPSARNGGVYVDGSGEKHPWQVAPNHTLIWQGAPFVPVGGDFEARSWNPNATPQDFSADVDALARLRQAGVTDLTVRPSGCGITQVPAERLQALIDALEGGGFTYGVALGDGPRSPLIAYQVQPSRLQVAGVGPGQTARFAIDALASARYAVALPSGEILDEGEAAVIDGSAHVPPKSPVSGAVAVLYPERIFVAARTPLPNVWEDFDEYRDRLLEQLGRVRFGKGLRFFIDPLPASLRTAGLARTLVPTGAGARTEFAVFLSNRYRNVGELVNAWRIVRPDAVRDTTDAASLVPMWFDGRGLKSFFHARTGQRIPAESGNSTYWSDLEAFKASSLRAYANQIATTLKRGVADVPVVVRASGDASWIAEPGSGDRFDGVAIDIDGERAIRASQWAANLFGQVGYGIRPQWLVVAGLQEARGLSPVGFASLNTLTQAVDRLTALGNRGVFVKDLHLATPDRELARLPDQLAWIAETKRRLETGGIASASGPRERSVPFPDALEMPATPLPDGGWWVPTNRTFRTYDFGPVGKAYGVSEGDSNIFVFWNPMETRTVKIRLPKIMENTRVTWYPVDRGSRSKDTLTLELGPDPVRVYGFEDTLPLPSEAFDEALKEAGKYLQVLRAQRQVDAARLQLELSTMRARYQPGNPQAAYTLLQTVLEAVERMKAGLRPFSYLWIEGEGGPDTRSTHAFDEIATSRGASGGKVLRVGDAGRELGPATALYSLNANTPLAYHLYVSANTGAVFQVRVDGRTQGDGPARTVGSVYGDDGLVWYDIGSVNLARGEHTIEVTADGAMSLDALMLASGSATPDGARKPPVLPASKEDKR